MTLRGWRWVTEAEATELGLEPDVLEHFGHVEAHGEPRYQIPDERPAPQDDATLGAIDAYRESVEAFAKEFLDDEMWAHEAVHRAVRDKRPIRLVPLPPADGVIAPANLHIDVRKGDVIPYDVVVVLQEFAERIPQPELKGELRSRARKATWDGALQAITNQLSGTPTPASTLRGNRHDARRYLTAAATGKLRPGK